MPAIKFRQETVFKNRWLEIINDTTATSPEATSAAVERFASKDRNAVLITGGTDGKLEYKKWAMIVKKYLDPKKIVFLNGSATRKMLKELKLNKPIVKETLKQCLSAALKIISISNKKSTIIFSPGAKSFEKFKHEFDRGDKFNQLVKSLKFDKM